MLLPKVFVRDRIKNLEKYQKGPKKKKKKDEGDANGIESVAWIHSTSKLYNFLT